MASHAFPRPWTVEDFLAFEAEQEERYEFVDGVVRMMTGASAAHSALKLNLAIALRNAVRGGSCRVDVDDLKVVTGDAVMYPDVLVTCVPVGPDDDRVYEPTVVVEVLSPTTETHDRVRKWRAYQTLRSLRHFVLVAQKERRIEVYSRTAEGWAFAVADAPDDTLALDAIGARLRLAEIYEDTGR
jgi:Uma2 family endonuclease